SQGLIRYLENKGVQVIEVTGDPQQKLQEIANSLAKQKISVLLGNQQRLWRTNSREKTGKNTAHQHYRRTIDVLRHRGNPHPATCK
ncbi:hypothetical protein, partial [Thermofilum sp.]|uniref:hypothetical protein n=1 Tax=Thermofilum sp. TaxID=1961369 RepID=UPI00316010C6